MGELVLRLERENSAFFSFVSKVTPTRNEPKEAHDTSSDFEARETSLGLHALWFRVT